MMNRKMMGLYLKVDLYTKYQNLYLRRLLFRINKHCLAGTLRSSNLYWARAQQDLCNDICAQLTKVQINLHSYAV